MISVVHEISQVEYVYILNENNAQCEQWSNQWQKIKGIYSDIKSIGEALKETSQIDDQDMVPISFIDVSQNASNKNLNQLEPSFMYTKIITEILFTINFDRQHIEEFLAYCKSSHSMSPTHIDMLEKEYHSYSSIWWYTHPCGLYSLLNYAIRGMDVEVMIRIGFFIRDLHQNITHLHSQQYPNYNRQSPFTVYRGQGLSRTNFEKLIKSKGGLLSFNNFLSTSKERNVTLDFALTAATESGSVGILFAISIDPSISSTPFANVRENSVFREEDEILFSMHSIFRIHDIIQIDSSHNVYQVNLTLTNDTDPDLHTLSEHIRANSLPHKTGWYRLGNLLIQMGQFNQAQELFEVMLHQTSNELEKANIYHMLGMIKYELGDYINAIELYEKSIKINQKILPPTHPDLAASYRNLGMVYDKMAKHSIIHSVEENPIETIITSSDLPFSTSDSNSDLVSASMDDYSKAVLSFENALTVLQQTFPPDGLTLVTFYELYGTVYEKLGDYNKALSLHKRALEIKQKHLPSNHPSLATSYANHGTAYQQIGDIPTARSYFRRALDIGQRSLPSNHPDLRRFREMIGND
ncbi:unnamed protein product [Adineta steineri]|uniref:NAD(+)--protein-arginine ADP-ribosyltransferase n=1 Tax=Adineta steineri TaxID=433720 RepID=A0A818ZPE4_9BILA|nr:unnamed protein product [Adineta steineri]CAF3767015.1 unnamed protein product [Adineta steineri]